MKERDDPQTDDDELDNQVEEEEYKQIDYFNRMPNSTENERFISANINSDLLSSLDDRGSGAIPPNLGI